MEKIKQYYEESMENLTKLKKAIIEKLQSDTLKDDGHLFLQESLNYVSWSIENLSDSDIKDII